MGAGPAKRGEGAVFFAFLPGSGWCERGLTRGFAVLVRRVLEQAPSRWNKDQRSTRPTGSSNKTPPPTEQGVQRSTRPERAYRAKPPPRRNGDQRRPVQQVPRTKPHPMKQVPEKSTRPTGTRAKPSRWNRGFREAPVRRGSSRARPFLEKGLDRRVRKKHASRSADHQSRRGEIGLDGGVGGGLGLTRWSALLCWGGRWQGGARIGGAFAVQSASAALGRPCSPGSAVGQLLFPGTPAGGRYAVRVYWQPLGESTDGLDPRR